MTNWRDEFPEAECIENGDPFLAEISKLDDIIIDHTYNFEGDEARRTARWATQMQLDFEYEVLERWWYGF
jgi:hypothetical protein